MSRQLRISDDVHEMLSLLKPSESTSYDEVIRDLIEDVCPRLPTALDDLKRLEKEDPRKAAGERLLLKQELVDEIIIERIIQRRESENECLIAKYEDSQRTEEQINENREFEAREERRRNIQRAKILLEKEGTRKNE